MFTKNSRSVNGSTSLIIKKFQLLILKENIEATQRKNRASYFDSRQSKLQKPNERVTDSTFGYTFLGNIMFSFDKTLKKYYFSNQPV